MIFGVGIDAVDIDRMRRAITRTPRIVERVFTAQERLSSRSRPRPEASYAARFAAKEACRKAVREAVRWRDVEIVAGPDRVPRMRVANRDDLVFHVSLSHTDTLAVAFVVAERRGLGVVDPDR